MLNSARHKSCRVVQKIETVQKVNWIWGISYQLQQKAVYTIEKPGEVNWILKKVKRMMNSILVVNRI